MRPGTTMAMYWSDAVMLKKMLVAMVVATSEPVDWAQRITELVIFTSSPADSMVPPNTMAERISQMVLSIPRIPVLVSSSLTISLGVVMAISPKMDCMTER